MPRSPMRAVTFLWAVLSASALAGAEGKEPPAAKHVRAAAEMMESAVARLPDLESLVEKERESSELVGQAQAITKEFKKARRELEWAALSAEADAKPGIEGIVESARKTSDILAALSKKTSVKVRAALAKAAKEAAKTRQAGELCLSDIASGKKRDDPFADSTTPGLPSNVDNLTREAVQSGASSH